MWDWATGVADLNTVESRDSTAAERWMCRMKDAGFADVVSYNTLIKAHLQGNNFEKVRSLMEEMRGLALQPNRTFNELVNATISRVVLRGANRFGISSQSCPQPT